MSRVTLETEAFFEPETAKQKAIALAAFDVFAEHGFRKTSMQRIAQKAGMSRPALYLHFQSKEDVFGYLVVDFFTKISTQIDIILAESGAPTQVLKQVFDAFDPGGVMEILLDAEHGNELLDVKADIAHDKVDELFMRIKSSLQAWLEKEALSGHIHCPNPAMASETIMASYYGLKTPPPSYIEYKSRVAQLAEICGRGLTA